MSPAQPARKREREGRKGAKSEAAGLKSGERRGEAKNRRRKAGTGLATKAMEEKEEEEEEDFLLFSVSVKALSVSYFPPL